MSNKSYNFNTEEEVIVALKRIPKKYRMYTARAIWFNLSAFVKCPILEKVCVFNDRKDYKVCVPTDKKLSRFLLLMGVNKRLVEKKFNESPAGRKAGKQKEAREGLTEWTCSTCHTTKGLDKFYKNKNNLHGYGYICRECLIKYDRKRVVSRKMSVYERRA